MANKTAAVTKTKKPLGRTKGSFVDNSAKAKEFAFKLKRYMAAKKLTQTQMGKLMLVHVEGSNNGKVVIARWAAGKHAPQKRNVERLNQLIAGKVNIETLP